MDAIRKRVKEVEANLASASEKLLITQDNLKNAVNEVDTPSIVFVAFVL